MKFPALVVVTLVLVNADCSSDAKTMDEPPGGLDSGPGGSEVGVVHRGPDAGGEQDSGTSAPDSGSSEPDGAVLSPETGTGASDTGTGGMDAGRDRSDGGEGEGDASHEDVRHIDAAPVDAAKDSSPPKDSSTHEDSGSRTTDCFAEPGACGYPDPSYGTVGATSPCSSLKASGSVSVTTAGETLENLNITGSLTISAANVTVNNVCVTASGNLGNMAVWIEKGATNLLLENSTFAGASSSGIGVLDSGVWNGYGIASVTGNKLYIYNAAETWNGPGTVNNSYLQAGATFDDSDGSSHNENVYLADSTWSGDHNTLLNSAPQTAVLFGDNNGGAKGAPGDNHWTVTNSLLGGGGWLLYANAGASGVGSSTMTFSNNRIARCKTTAVYNMGSGGNACSGGPDQYGYYPFGGYYGGPVDLYCPPTAGQTWSDNVWDDDSSTLACPQ